MKKRIVFIIFPLTVMMFGYQNCAQQPLNDETVVKEGPVVDKIDDVDAHKSVYFEVSSVSVHEDVEAVYISGACDSKGILSWKLLDGDQVVDKGRSHCVDGRFEVNLAEMSDKPCGDLSLTAQFGLGEVAVTELQRACENSANRVESASAAPLCQLEYDVSEGSCERACYDENNAFISAEEMPLLACQ